MTTEQERNALLNALLPTEPEPGQVVEMPEGQSAGASQAIFLYRGDDLIGTASSYAPIENVAKKGMLTRASVNTELKVGDVLRVTYSQFDFTSVVFVDHFGWLGKNFYKSVTVYDRLFKVVHVFPIGHSCANYRLYERVCIEAYERPEKEKKNAQRVPKNSGRSPGKNARTAGGATARTSGNGRSAATPTEGAE